MPRIKRTADHREYLLRRGTHTWHTRKYQPHGDAAIQAVGAGSNWFSSEPHAVQRGGTGQREVRRMKQFLVIVTSLALAALMSGVTLDWLPAECDAVARTHCCSETSSEREQVPPADSTCLRYCAACCAVVVSPVIELAMPHVYAAPWISSNLDGDVRREPPPLPPPRAT